MPDESGVNKAEREWVPKAEAERLGARVKQLKGEAEELAATVERRTQAEIDAPP